MKVDHKDNNVQRMQPRAILQRSRLKGQVPTSFIIHCAQQSLDVADGRYWCAVSPHSSCVDRYVSALQLTSTTVASQL